MFESHQSVPHFNNNHHLNSKNNHIKLAVIGGGRWSKVVLNVLAKLNLEIDSIALVSTQNYNATVEFAKVYCKEKSKKSDFITVHRNLHEVLNDDDITHVYIANLPHYHFQSALESIRAGKHVLVEKPFNVSTEELKSLVELARNRSLLFMINHEFRLASYIHDLRSELIKNPSDIKRIDIVWNDAFIEKKWEQIKTPDYTTNVLNDLFPHVISILITLFGEKRISLSELNIEDGGDHINLTFLYDTYEVFIDLSRLAKQTTRYIALEFLNDDTYHLDFTQEPGKLTFNKNEISIDAAWSRNLKPLEAALALFFQSKDSLETTLDMSNNIFSVNETNLLNQIVEEKQIEFVNSFLVNSYPLSSVPRKILVALRCLLLSKLIDLNIISNPKDLKTINPYLETIWNIIHRLATSPFVSQQTMATELNISKQELIELNAVIRETSWIQNLITEKSISSKYWKNTIIPIVQSGSIDKALTRQNQYPYRIGIYPGVSCMFYCFFCGRNNKAKYPKSSIVSGVDFFKRLFRDAPKSDPYRFYISGGLEPLTNPHIGEIISSGATNGFKLSIYTNAFMLTESILDRQPGLWDADTIRVSLYGVDQESTFKVTNKSNAFEKVIFNVKSFLALRNQKNSPLKIGLNYVLLRNNLNDVLKLAELIAEINRDSGNDRQIDFLTLREDYSQNNDGEITDEERVELTTIFKTFEERLKQEDLSNLHVDYGYSLEALRRGNPYYKMEMVSFKEMRPKGYPQISVVTDLYKDVYLYREAGFIERPGATRYVMGRSNDTHPFEKVITDFITNENEIIPQDHDTDYFDIFDHVITKLLNKFEADINFGIPAAVGPIKDLIWTKQAHDTMKPKLMTHFAVDSTLSK